MYHLINFFWSKGLVKIPITYLKSVNISINCICHEELKKGRFLNLFRLIFTLVSNNSPQSDRPIFSTHAKQISAHQIRFNLLFPWQGYPYVPRSSWPWWQPWCCCGTSSRGSTIVVSSALPERNQALVRHYHTWCYEPSALFRLTYQPGVIVLSST